MSRSTRRKTLFLFMFIFGLYYLSLGLVRANVDLLYFRAESGVDTIALEWETATELDNLGFNILRSETGLFDNAQTINPTLIPSLVGGQPIGAYYRWIDEDVRLNVVYTYWLQDVDFNGETEEHGPVEASVIGGNPIPTAQPTNTAQPTASPTATATVTVQPTATPTFISLSQPQATETATPVGAAPPTDIPTSGPASPTPSSAPVLPTQTIDEIEQPATIPATITADSRVGDSKTVTPNSMVTGSGPQDPDEQQIAGAIAEATFVRNLAGVTEKDALTGDESSSAGDITAKTIGEGISQNELPAGASLSDETSSGSNTLAIVILVAALVIALGGSITVWLLLKPQKADGENE